MNRAPQSNEKSTRTPTDSSITPLEKPKNEMGSMAGAGAVMIPSTSPGAIRAAALSAGTAWGRSRVR